MKIFILTVSLLGFFLTGFTASAKVTLVCLSEDYNPLARQGQGLNVTFSNGQIVEIQKREGSYYCDKGTVRNPPLVFGDESVQVYDVTFNCGDKYGQIVLPANFAVQKGLLYNFMDAQLNDLRWTLICR